LKWKHIYIYKAQKEAKSEDFLMEVIVFPESSATGKNPGTDNSGIKAKWSWQIGNRVVPFCLQRIPKGDGTVKSSQDRDENWQLSSTILPAQITKFSKTKFCGLSKIF